jgi:hypothetical protein
LDVIVGLDVVGVGRGVGLDVVGLDAVGVGRGVVGLDVIVGLDVVGVGRGVGLDVIVGLDVVGVGLGVVGLDVVGPDVVGVRVEGPDVFGTLPTHIRKPLDLSLSAPKGTITTGSLSLKSCVAFFINGLVTSWLISVRSIIIPDADAAYARAAFPT